MNLAVGLTILGHRGLWKAIEQGRRSGDVLAYLSEVGKGFIIGDDPSVHVMGPGACAPTVSAVFDLSIDFRVFLNKLLSGFVDLPLLGSQLLHTYARWGRCISFGFATEVACWGSLLRGDAFDVSLGGTRHETFLGGVVAPPAGVRARVRPRPLREEAVEGFREAFDHHHELVVRRGRNRALCHKVAYGRRGVAEIEQKRRRGAPCGVF